MNKIIGTVSAVAITEISGGDRRILSSWAGEERSPARARGGAGRVVAAAPG
jgi:hypothetical protein